MPTADLVLSRFPRHLDADQPGKVIGDVVGSLATPLDTQISQVGKLRRTHRSGEVEQRIDLLRLGALHGFDERSLVPVQRRLAVLAGRDVAADPAPGPRPARPDEAAPWHRSRPRAPTTARPGPAGGRARGTVAAHDAWLGDRPAVLIAAIADQRHRSTTVGGLLGATADYLGFERRRDPPRRATAASGTSPACRDRVIVVRAIAPAGDPGTPPDEALRGRHLLALEENPPYLADLGPIPRRHADRFHVTRKGFETVAATVIVKGRGGPDAGSRWSSTSTTASGRRLDRHRAGTAPSCASSATAGSSSTAPAWPGAATSSAAPSSPRPARHPKDFVFADADDPTRCSATVRRPRWAPTRSRRPLADAFDAGAVVPARRWPARGRCSSTGPRRGSPCSWAPGLRRPSMPTTAPTVLAAPEPVAGFFDESVFLPDPAGAAFVRDRLRMGRARGVRRPGLAAVRPPTARRGRRAVVREVVRLLLDRHRAAGVHVYVEYADPRWIARHRRPPRPRQRRRPRRRCGRHRGVDRRHRSTDAHPMTDLDRTEGASSMALEKPPLATVEPGRPITAQGWNAIVDALGRAVRRRAGLRQRQLRRVGAGRRPVGRRRRRSSPSRSGKASPSRASRCSGRATTYLVTGVSDGAWRVHVSAPGYATAGARRDGAGRPRR